MTDNNKKFSYSYSPTDKQEIEAIKRKYEPAKEKDLADEIKSLDAKIENTGTVLSICFGLIFSFIFGAGLSLCLTKQIYDLGIILGIIGLIGMGITTPLHNRMNERRRQKASKKIIALCDEYLKSDIQ